jgi:DNA-binding FadR family transcriptional regulator
VTAALREHLEVEQDSPSATDREVVSTYRCLRRIARSSANPEFDRCLEDVLARLVRYLLLDPVRAAGRTEALSLRAVVEAVLEGAEDVAREEARQYVALDAARLTGAIMDSELIRSVKLAPPTPTSIDGVPGVREG